MVNPGIGRPQIGLEMLSEQFGVKEFCVVLKFTTNKWEGKNYQGGYFARLPLYGQLSHLQSKLLFKTVYGDILW